MAPTKEPAPSQEAIDAVDALAAENAVRHPRRAAEIAGGMGSKLETIAGREVTIIGLEFDVRDIKALQDDPEAGVSRGQLTSRPVAFILIQPQPGFEDHGPERYYTWSKPLIDKLHVVAEAEDGLPALAIFEKVTLDDGRTVWSFR
jgi:hypothetical protein